MRYLLALVVSVLLCTPALAQDPEPWDFSRAAGGLDVGGVMYDGVGTTTGLNQSGVILGAWLSYSLASKLSVPVTAQWDWVSERYAYTAGGRFALHGTERHDRWHLGIGVDFVHYEGDGYAMIPVQDSWRATVKGTWTMLADKGGRSIIYLPIWVDYDPENELWRYVAALRWQVFGGS